MNKLFKRVLASTLALTTVAGMAISASAYNLDRITGPLKLDTKVSTANGTQAWTKEQRAMYPVISLDDLYKSNEFIWLREDGVQDLSCGQKYMGIPEYANKVGTIAAIFEDHENSGAWPYTSIFNPSNRFNHDVTTLYEYGTDNIYWPEALAFQNTAPGKQVILQKLYTKEHRYSVPGEQVWPPYNPGNIYNYE